MRKNIKKQKQTKKHNSKKNIEHRNIGYPALDPTANKYISGSGWEIYVCSVCCLCCYVFLRVVFLLFVCFYMCLFDCKCKSLQRLGENIKKRKQKQTTLRKTFKKKTEISQPEPERYLFAVGSRAGYPVFMFVVLFLEFVCFCLWFFLFCCCFRIVCLSFCIYNRKRKTYKNICLNTKIKNKKQNNSKENIKTKKEKEISQPEPERYLFAEVRGLDILYFCCCLCCSSSFLCLLSVSLCFLLFSHSLFKLLLEHNTIHYTKHKQT